MVMNIIITGHRGLIGSFLKRQLERDGHNIILALDKRSGRDLNLLESQDILKADIFIHTAAFCKINKAIADPKLGHQNALDNFQVFEFCRKNKIPKIIYFSSSRVLNQENNPYTASKVYGEELCKAYHDCYGIDYIIIRPSTVYGPFWDLTQRLIHIFITNAIKGQDLKIFGDPKTKTLDFTYVKDFVKGVNLTMNHNWNEDYDISGEEEYNIFNLAELIIKEANSKSQIKIVDPEIAQPQQVNLDISKIKKLRYKPQTPLKFGIKKTIKWYQDYFQKHPELLE